MAAFLAALVEPNGLPRLRASGVSEVVCLMMLLVIKIRTDELVLDDG